MDRAVMGDWVEVYQVILAGGERAPQVPEDTQRLPLELRVKGFLVQEKGRVGEEAVVRTVTGREVTGNLTAILPGYSHNFGSSQPELVHLGTELRNILKGGSSVG